MPSSSSVHAAFAFAKNSDWARTVPAAREALAADPDNANVHALLAIALAHIEQPREAVDAARRAVALDPESSFAHYALGRALFDNDDAEGAERSAREALRLDPDAAGYTLLAQTFLQRSRWQEALDAATRGLEIEPDHQGCASLRARALLHMGRSEEADAVVRDSLAHDPENADAHANRGWLLLRQSKPEEALESFRSALRIDPTFVWAREGIIEALKARKGVYRLFLRYSFWMGSLTPRARWIVIIGLFVLARAVRGALKENPEAMPVLGPLVGLYVLFVLGTWIAGPLSNLLLRFDPFGRLALGRDQIMASNLIAGCLVLALFGGVMLAITGADAWIVVAASSALLMMPIGGAFSGYGTRAWRPLFTGLIVIAACAATAMVLAFTRFDLAVFPLLGQFLGSFVFAWVANYLVIKYQ
jgi:tetratricopeptide (TPR) repeat protein